jgi:hypothetical protein
MGQVFSVGEILLDVMCGAIMIYFLLIGLNQINTTNSIIARDIQSSQYQEEYNTFARYDSSIVGAFSYVEALDCVYSYASFDLPVIVYTGNSPSLNNTVVDQTLVWMNENPNNDNTLKNTVEARGGTCYMTTPSSYDHLALYLRTGSLTYYGRLVYWNSSGTDGGVPRLDEGPLRAIMLYRA